MSNPHLDPEMSLAKHRFEWLHILFAGSLELAYSLIWGSHKIWGKGGGDSLDLL